MKNIIIKILNIQALLSSESCSCLTSISESLSFEYDSVTQTRDNTRQGIGCSDHDVDLPPFCDSSPVNFCDLNWCQVDENSCQIDDMTISEFFPDLNLYQSQKTCGDEQNFARFITNANKSSAELKGMVDDYVIQFRKSYLKAIEEKKMDCDTKDSCGQFTSNPQDDLWLDQRVTPNKNMKVEFDSIFINSPVNANSHNDYRLFTCLAKTMENEFLATARREYRESDTSRVAYMQGGEIHQGNYQQWPITDVCLGDYDPRQRAWFANSATGPKDVIIIIDTSGSMATGTRINDAKTAAKAILDTMTSQDQVGIILFNNIATQQNRIMIPMTDGNKSNMKTFIDNQVTPFGGTNFEFAFDMAFTMIQESQAEAMTSTCLRAILFLTDGEADLDIESLVKRNQEQDFKIFAQALGDEADNRVTKALSCRTQAISQSVPDSSNLADVMAGYYHYFSAGINDENPRWIYYSDQITGELLQSSCVSLYDGKLFKGVTCMDINLLLELSVLQNKSDQDTVFVQANNNSNNRCPVFSFEKIGIDLEQLRTNSGGESCVEPSQIWLWIVFSICIGLCGCFVYYICQSKKQKDEDSSSNGVKQRYRSSSSSNKHRPKQNSTKLNVNKY